MKKILQHMVIWLVLIFLYLPILILAVYSFTDSTMIGSIRQFSLENYITLFTEEELLQMMGGTINLAIGVAILSTLLGTIGAIGLFYSKKRVMQTMDIINEIPVANADVVTGFSICVFLVVVLGMDKATYIPLVIAQTVLCTPFVYLSVMPRLKMMDGALYEAALDLGSTPSHALRKVIIPQILPGITSGFLTAITLSLDDYFIATYTKPATFNTISTYVVNATKGAQTKIKTALWALSTIIFLVVVLMVVIINIRANKMEEEAHA